MRTGTTKGGVARLLAAALLLAGSGARAADGLLDTACTPGQKLIVKDPETGDFSDIVVAG